MCDPPPTTHHPHLHQAAARAVCRAAAQAGRRAGGQLARKGPRQLEKRAARVAQRCAQPMPSCDLGVVQLRRQHKCQACRPRVREGLQQGAQALAVLRRRQRESSSCAKDCSEDEQRFRQKPDARHCAGGVDAVAPKRSSTSVCGGAWRNRPAWAHAQKERAAGRRPTNESS